MESKLLHVPIMLHFLKKQNVGKKTQKKTEMVVQRVIVAPRVKKA